MARKQLQNLTEPMYYVLLCLRTPLHGYGIMQKIEAMTQGRLRVGPGTLYNLLARFEKEDIVNQVQGSGKKKCYLLTPRGEVFLKKDIFFRSSLFAFFATLVEFFPDRCGSWQV